MATLAEVLRQGGYSQNGQIVRQPSATAQSMNQYLQNIVPNAMQNLAQQRSDIDASLIMGDQGIQIGDPEAYAKQMEAITGVAGMTKVGKNLVPSAYQQAYEYEKRTGIKMKPSDVASAQKIYDLMAKERELKNMKPSDFPRWGDFAKSEDYDIKMLNELQKKVEQQRVLDMLQEEKLSRRQVLEKQIKESKK
jgi:hypothetical protein